ncbi:hypothetical protein Bca4012_019276 [Brassica carinata]
MEFTLLFLEKLDARITIVHPNGPKMHKYVQEYLSSFCDQPSEIMLLKFDHLQPLATFRCCWSDSFCARV